MTSTDTAAPADAGQAALSPAKAPLGAGATPLVAQLTALGLVALGVVGLQDLLARTDLIAQQPWLDSAVTALDATPSDSVWVLVGGVAAVLLGLALLLTALRRRPRRSLELRARTGVRLRTRDLATLVRHRLETVDGVTDVDVRARRRRLRVVATGVVRDERRGGVVAELERRLEPTLQALEHPPRSRVKLKEGAS
jgi:hypothetical protein